MVDISLFDELSKVNGYMGAVLSDFTGEILVSDASKVKSLDETSMRFNEDFRNIHEMTDKLGLGHTRTMEIDAENATIVMVCSGVDARVHLHAFVIMTKDGSVGLAKMALRNLVNKAATELS